MIQDAARLAEKSAGHPIDINQIDYNDKAVLDSIGTGRTDGVFQLESAGMKTLHERTEAPEPGGYHRPGSPCTVQALWISFQVYQGKNNVDSITYDCPHVKAILEPTYGCIVYQEQVMQIVRDLGGYTLGRSDLVRRAMSKKKGDVMQKERQNFVYGNPEEGVRAVCPTALTRRQPTRSMMK